MDKATTYSMAVLLGLLSFVITLTFVPNAHACTWNDCLWGVVSDKTANKGVYANFDVRQHHASDWHNSPVCGLEICNGHTASSLLKYQGMTKDGTKPTNIDPRTFDGHYFIKGNFTK
jgi:hypothetical protein